MNGLRGAEPSLITNKPRLPITNASYCEPPLNRGVRLVSSQQEVQHELVEPGRVLQLRSVAGLLDDLQPSAPVQRPEEHRNVCTRQSQSVTPGTHRFGKERKKKELHNVRAENVVRVPLNRKRLLQREQLVVVSPYNQHVLHKHSRALDHCGSSFN